MMKETNKKTCKDIKESLKLTTFGFTLVELLAVIVILAIILVIAVPKVMSVIEDAKKATLESTAKMIASAAEKQKVQNTVLGNEENITCESITNINKEDYPSCSIEFEDNTAKVTIVGGGKFEGLNICGGTKTNAKAQKDECRIDTFVTHIQELYENETTRLSNGLTKDNTIDENIRYSGSNDDVKNYVEFGNTGEIWRIIGVFNVTNANGKTEPLVKLIRGENIDDTLRINWDSSASTVNKGDGINEWSQADLQSMLNTYYIGNSLTCTCCTDRREETCEYSCDDEVTPINNTYKNMIENVVWNTGALDLDIDLMADPPVVNASDLYNKERGTVNGKICSATLEDGSENTKCNDTVTRTTTWEGLVALPYASDFVYASSVEECKNSIYSLDCRLNNWLHSEDGLAIWLLSPMTDLEYSSLVGIWLSGFTIFNGAAGGSLTTEVLPATYLKANVKIIDGDGSREKPYKLK